MAHVHQCGQCMTTERRPRHREITSQVWTLLSQWGEVEEAAVAQPLCDSCYHDIREILIDRSVEMERAFATGSIEAPAKKKRVAETSAMKGSSDTAAAKPTPRKASATARGRKTQKVGRIAS